MQRKQGISLIVLVITIIVMIILAAAIILSLNNAGIIGNANKAVEMTDEANVKQIAQLGWSDSYIEHREDVAKLREGVETALVDSGLNPDDYGMIVTTKGVDIVKGWIQDGTKVIKGDRTLTVGDTINYTAKGTEYNKGWKILGAENGELLIMSADSVSTLELGSSTDVEKSKTDYITGIQRLNHICTSYGNGDKATGARSIKIEDINRVTGYKPNEVIFGKGNLNEYGTTRKVVWNGASNPISYLDDGTVKVITNENLEHNGKFIYFDGKEFVTSTNEGATAVSPKVITTIKNSYYYYYPTTLTHNEEGEKIGLKSDTEAYKMLFKNSQNISDSYWVATRYSLLGDFAAGFGMLRVSTSEYVQTKHFINSAGKCSGLNIGVRAVVKLSKDLVLTEGTTTDWSL